MGDAPDLHALLAMLCPLSDPETGVLVASDGLPWPADAPTTLAALCLLPEATLEALASDYPTASRSAREHISGCVGMLAATLAEAIQRAGNAQAPRIPPRGTAYRAIAADVSNALAFAKVLDGILGAERDGARRGNTLPVALKVFETGTLPQPVADAAEDTEAFVSSVFPSTDYLAADRDLRERAGAYLMLFVLASECGLPCGRWEPLGSPPEAEAAFAREHLHDPARWAAAVREHRTLDPEELRPALGNGAAG